MIEKKKVENFVKFFLQNEKIKRAIVDKFIYLKRIRVYGDREVKGFNRVNLLKDSSVANFTTIQNKRGIVIY